jgi:crotonobetainyl-CoA:carnitine CoA-transferase CaiB-like acyl-CoA transferase
MARMPDQDQGTARGHILAPLHVNFGHERAGRVEHVQAALFRVALDGLRNTVRAENRHGALRHLVEFFDEARAFLAQVVHHVAIVNNLVANIHGRAVLL